ncbi:hypothetical protein MUK42_28396 [Musa troglodytarum]|uniref:Uncharacterized protein n=1 Tax=Musa troglodytarum TaxID=320322 RepID=A0A9E7JN19_9LILI|nr:hypothetical protein MUK42_28396 [Musa troglodytarum]
MVQARTNEVINEADTGCLLLEGQTSTHRGRWDWNSELIPTNLNGFVQLLDKGLLFPSVLCVHQMYPRFELRS